MNLIVDIGNSAAKVALVLGGQVQTLHLIPEPTAQAVSRLLDPIRDTIDKAILSSVRRADPTLQAEIQRWVGGRLIHFGPQTPVPLENQYQTPQTLGSDRLAAAVGAWEHSDKQSELLVVDFGTAITIDRISPPGCYLGGNISPGPTMRLKALHEQTDRLPLIPAEELEREPYGCAGWDTHSAVVGGVVQGILYEIEGYIDLISTENSRSMLFFTGPAAKFFADKLKKPIFVANDLVIGGLNAILEYNTGR